MKISIVATVIVIVACSTPSTVAPLTIPLQYKTMASPRDEKTIGKRFVEGKNAPAATVTTTSDVPAWVTAGVESAVKRTGITTKAGAPVLAIAVDQITTSENVLHRAGYEAHISVSAELRSAGGAACWKGHADGSAENYGYAGSTENYQETLNHALDRAIIRVLGAPELKKTICFCG